MHTIRERLARSIPRTACLFLHLRSRHGDQFLHTHICLFTLAGVGCTILQFQKVSGIIHKEIIDEGASHLWGFSRSWLKIQYSK